MYDIYFDLNNMHQEVEETSASQISTLYDEFTAVAKAQSQHQVDDVQEFWLLGEAFSFDFVHEFPVDKLEEDDEDDFAVIVERKSSGCTCDHCGEFYPYAEPKKGIVFKCWSCRNF